MQYLLLMGFDETAEPQPEDDCRVPGPGADALAAWVADMDRRGIELLAGERLELGAAARTVRERKGDLLVTDGPFAETKEQIDGFQVIDCKSLEEASEAASLHPSARSGKIEVRKIFQS
jgi:hypothetical protein